MALNQLRQLKDLNHYRIRARDGELGTVDDLYFDAVHWRTRYLLVNTGRWLRGRKVLLPPHVIRAIDDGERQVEVSLTAREVENSPPLEHHKPLSRQYEEAYFRHFGWPPYWGDATALGVGLPPAPVSPPEPETEAGPQAEDLRSAADLVGYHLVAEDGDVGHVDDVIVDDADWDIRYLEVDTRNWLPGRRVLLATPWLRRTSWVERQVEVAAKRETIKNAPAFKEDEAITRDYEARVYQHYGKAGYWEAGARGGRDHQEERRPL